jgi:RNA 2',3'-cyclic 3'-phosphodiesterase
MPHRLRRARRLRQTDRDKWLCARPKHPGWLAPRPALHYPGMRLFIGIPLAAETTAELSALVARLRSGGGALRWTAPDSWHITLQFLGNASPEQLQCLTAGLAEVRSAPVAVQIGDLGAFDRTGVFFADVAVSAGLAALQVRVVAATGQCGFVAETRPFHPHITLARKTGNKKTGNKGTRRQEDRRNEGGREQGSELRRLISRAGSQLSFTRFTAHEFLLYESHLGPEGSRYEVLGRFALGSRS